MTGQRRKADGKNKATRAAAEKAAAERARLRQGTRPLIVRAAELIEDRSHWTRRAFARDRHSHPVSASSGRAVRFCVGGALLRAAAEQLDLSFRLPRPGKEFSPIETLGFEALNEAYALVGRAIEMIFYRSNSVRFREVEEGGYRQVVIETAPEGQRKRGKAARDSLVTTWSEFVHSFNDAPQIRHGDIRPALALAALWAFDGRTTPPSKGSKPASGQPTRSEPKERKQ